MKKGEKTEPPPSQGNRKYSKAEVISIVSEEFTYFPSD